MKSCPNTNSSSGNGKNRRWSEAHLVQGALRRVEKAGLLACREVSLLGRCVDLAFIQQKRLVTVEFKLRNWRKALSQAVDHLLAADHAYVCMPRRVVSDVMREEFSKVGVGLFFYRGRGDWPFETVIEAPKSMETWSVARSLLLERIRSNQREPK